MVSFAPYMPPVRAPDLQKAFLDGKGVIAPITLTSNDNATAKAGQVSQVDSGAETLDLNPGRRDLMARLKTLIVNGKTDEALNLITRKAETSEMKAIADKVQAAFEDYGHDEAAREMKQIMPDVTAPKTSGPSESILKLRHSVLVM